VKLKIALVVDDERILNVPDVDEVVHVQSSSEAIAYLQSHPVIHQLWLDHDLGPDDVIMRLVDHIAEEAFFGRGYDIDEIVVHTMNPVGSDNIIRTLERYYPIRRASVLPYIESIHS